MVWPLLRDRLLDFGQPVSIEIENGGRWRECGISYIPSLVSFQPCPILPLIS
jgi:hypothetical protein